MNIYVKRKFVVILVFLAGIAQPFFAYAQVAPDIALDRIISDEEMVRYQTMDQSDIQRFLESKSSYLKSFSDTTDEAELLRASEIIYRAAQTYRLNPQFILTLLQKEQSLIEDSSPDQRQLDWAAGYGCFDGQACNDRWRGFRKQVMSAAEQFRYYYDNINEYNYRPGKESVIDGMSVTPKNVVTAALYNYTPHLHGNNLFKTLWERYFVQDLPDGTLVQVKGEPGVWLIRDGMKYAFTSKLALVSRYNPNSVVPITATDLQQYTQGFDIAFPAYSVLKAKTSKKMYLLTVDQKRLITSPEVFRSLGFNPEEVDDVDDARLDQIPDGLEITLGDAYPTGTIIQNSETKDYFYVESGRKYPLLSKDMIKVNFPNQPITKVKSSALDNYSTGLPILFKDGTLLKGSTPEVYVISNQMKRLIPSENVFLTIGYKWNNIITTSDEVVSAHPTGDPVVLK